MTYVPIPEDAFAVVLQNAMANRIKFMALGAEKLRYGQGTFTVIPCRKSITGNNLRADLQDRNHGCQEYVYLTAKRVSRTCGGFAGARLANCVPTL